MPETRRKPRLLSFRKRPGKPPAGWPEGWKLNCYQRLVNGVPDEPSWRVVAWPEADGLTKVETTHHATAQAAIRAALSLIRARENAAP